MRDMWRDAEISCKLVSPDHGRHRLLRSVKKHILHTLNFIKPKRAFSCVFCSPDWHFSLISRWPTDCLPPKGRFNQAFQQYHTRSKIRGLVTTITDRSIWDTQVKNNVRSCPLKHYKRKNQKAVLRYFFLEYRVGRGCSFKYQACK